MCAISRSCVLLLWMCTLAFVRSEDCTLAQFLSSDLYDSNFDTTNLEASYPGGKSVRVSCNVGFSGFFKLVCVEGKWESRGKKCQPRPCGHPGDAQFADFHLETGTDYVFGSQIVYTCHKGYQMISRSNRRRCMSEGWDGVVPVCEAQQCPVINVEQTMQVDGDTEEATYGNVIRFSCKSNSHVLEGSPEIHCDETGEWSGPVPKCKEIKCTQPTIENGYVLEDIPEYKEHAVLHFQCYSGYERSDPRASVCTKVGIRAEWSPMPACEEVTCTLKWPLIGAAKSDPAFTTVFSPGRNVTITCKHTHWIHERHKTSATLTCQASGEWDISPVCKEVVCRAHDNLVDYWALYWQTKRLGDTVYYTCRSGYRKTGGATDATCTREGWSPKPLCQEITCTKPDIWNGYVPGDIQEYSIGATLHYECHLGYVRYVHTPRCSRTGNGAGWSPKPACKPRITCKVSTTRGTRLQPVKSDYEIRETLQVICDDNFWISTLQQTWAVATCRDNGQWDIAPVCTAQLRETTCTKPDIGNGYVPRDIQEYRIDDILHYGCNFGYVRTEHRPTCIRTGNGADWSPKPACEPHDACPKADLPNGFIVGPYNGTLYYSCNEGYKLLSKGWWGEAKCDNGKWSGLRRCIDEGACGEIPVIPNGAVNPSARVYGQNEHVTIHCKEGYEPQVQNMTCLSGKWDTNGIPAKNICRPILKKCHPPPKLPNAVVMSLYQKQYLSGSVVTYQCRKNYEMDGEAGVRCTDGEWELNNLQCAYFTQDE